MSEITLLRAETDADIAASFPVLRQLRPHLADAADAVARVRRQRAQGYALTLAMGAGRVVGAVGHRIQENLVRGRFAYVDDLVVDEAERQQGIGARLLDEVARVAKEARCDWVVLDTALGNALGQRFYFRWGLLSSGLHFARRLE